MAVLMGLNPLSTGQILQRWWESQYGWNLSLNPLSTGQILQSNCSAQSIGYAMCLNPLSTGQILQSYVDDDNGTVNHVLIPSQRGKSFKAY